MNRENPGGVPGLSFFKAGLFSTASEAIREQCKAREKHIIEMNTVLKKKGKERREKEIALAKLEIPA